MTQSIPQWWWSTTTTIIIKELVYLTEGEGGGDAGDDIEEGCNAGISR